MEFAALIVILGLVVWVQNYLYGRYGMKNIRYTCRFSTSEAFEGDEIEIIEEVVNGKFLPLPWFKAEISTSKWLDFAGTQSVVSDRTRFVSSFYVLKSYHKVLRKWKVKCLKRGVFTLDKVVLVASDLLGHVTLSEPVNIDGQITVLPKPLLLDELEISSRHLSGELVVRRHLIADPFHIAGIRVYQDGDPMGRISWAATARTKQLMVFENEYTTSQSMAVILNIQSRAFENVNIVDQARVENCIRICASYFDSTLATGIPVRFLANAPVGAADESTVSNEFAGTEHIMNLLRMLSQLRLYGTEDFDAYLHNLYDHIRATDIILVTSYISEAMLEFYEKKKYEGVRVKILTLGTIPEGCTAEIYSLVNAFYNKGEDASHANQTA